MTDSDKPTISSGWLAVVGFVAGLVTVGLIWLALR